MTVTHFLDGFGGSHELKAGLDYQDMNGGFFYSSQNSIQQWDTYNGNIYYYRGLYGLSGPDPVLGDGLLTFATQATSELGSGFPDLFRRGGGFVSDTWRVNDRLTLNLGLRYDKTSSRIPDIVKPSADALAVAIGEAVFVPAYGINPFGPLEAQGLNDRIPWKGFSGQAGLAYSLTSDHKTIVN